MVFRHFSPNRIFVLSPPAPVVVMTRYARAKGGAASNAREPEEATSWAEMRRAMMKNRTEENPELEEDQAPTEAEIGESEESESGDGDGGGGDDDDDDDNNEGDAVQLAESLNSGSVDRPDADKAVVVADEDDSSPKKKKRKRNKDKCLQCKQKGHLKMSCPLLSEERRKELQDLVRMKQERKGKGTGRKKKKKKSRDSEGVGAGDCQPDQGEIHTETARSPGTRKGGSKNVRKDKAGQVVQKGEGLFQGFRVKAEDAKRLQELRKNLSEKGLKGGELEAELKKERRRAEKELARFNKMLCYHCRRPGHLLSECRQAQEEALKKEGKVLQPSGQCYKCGSEEHTSKECKSRRKGGDAFAFAVCFICKETGHLAKACPDNPRGLYPRGGGCRLCGSVEHLKSDCPRKAEKDTRQEVRAETVDSTALEVEEAAPDAKRRRKEGGGGGAGKKKKVVNF